MLQISNVLIVHFVKGNSPSDTCDDASIQPPSIPAVSMAESRGDVKKAPTPRNDWGIQTSTTIHRMRPETILREPVRLFDAALPRGLLAQHGRARSMRGGSSMRVGLLYAAENGLQLVILIHRQRERIVR